MRQTIIRIVICLILGAATTVAVAWGCVIRWQRQSPEARANVQSVVRSDSGLTEVNGGKPLTWFAEVAGCYECYQSPSPPPSEDLLELVYLEEGYVEASREEFSELLPAWSRLRVEEPVETMPGMGFGQLPMFREIGVGWPWLALRGEYVRNIDVDAAGLFVRRFSMRRGIIEIPVKDGHWSHPIIVPLRPIWPGFIGSVILYGSAWLIVLTMPGVLRRTIRRRRGRCPMCNYDLRGQRLERPHPRPLSHLRSGEREVEIGCPECGWRREHAA